METYQFGDFTRAILKFLGDLIKRLFGGDKTA
jgi:hypothetical protein